MVFLVYLYWGNEKVAIINDMSKLVDGNDVVQRELISIFIETRNVLHIEKRIPLYIIQHLV